MPKFFRVVLGTLALSALALAQTSVANSPDNRYHAPDDAFQVRYAANLAVGDSVVNITNAGTEGGFEPYGNICANVYVFSEDQQLVSCCTCPLTPNHLKTLSVRNDLINNTLTPGVPIGVTVALLATEAPQGAGQSCNAATLPGGVSSISNNWYFPPLAEGMRAWGTTIHATPGGTYGVTETEFTNAKLSDSELWKLQSYCGFIQANGSGYGICNPCRQGAAGANKQ